MTGRPVAVAAGEAGVRRVPVNTVERHVSLVDAYRSQAGDTLARNTRTEAGDTLVGVTALVTVAAVDVAGRRRLSVSVVATNHVAQTAERRAAVGTDEVLEVP